MPTPKKTRPRTEALIAFNDGPLDGGAVRIAMSVDLSTIGEELFDSIIGVRIECDLPLKERPVYIYRFEDVRDISPEVHEHNPQLLHIERLYVYLLAGRVFKNKIPLEPEDLVTGQSPTLLGVFGLDPETGRLGNISRGEE